LLIPENDDMKPIVIPPDDPGFAILGKMVLLVRQAKNMKRFDEFLRLMG
jgi:hypothetical protein